MDSRLFIRSDLFPDCEDLGPRHWGKEVLLGYVEGRFTFKMLEMKKGMKGGLQYHRKKDEFGFLVSGLIIIRYDLGDGQLREEVITPGTVFHFPPFMTHQEEAVEDSLVLEASTPYLNDRVRVDERYGFASSSGLPTTSESEIRKL